MGRWALRTRRGGRAGPQSGGTVLVTSASHALNDVTFNFDTEIDNEPTTPPPFLVSGQMPASIVSVGLTNIVLHYDASIEDLDPWSIASAAPGLTFAGDTTLALPQHGTLEV